MLYHGYLAVTSRFGDGGDNLADQSCSRPDKPAGERLPAAIPRRHVEPSFAVSGPRPVQASVRTRGSLADLISTACGLLGQAQAAGVPDVVRLELVAALSHAEKADKLAQERMKELYDFPTPAVANVNEAAA